MFPSTGEGGRADGASAGRADGASAGSCIPEGVSTGPPDIGQALLAARPGDDPAVSRGEKQAPNDVEYRGSERTGRALSRCDVLKEFHRNHPGRAPPIDPLEVYCLFPPGVDARLDLANPGIHLWKFCRSYLIRSLRGCDVRVRLAKRCFEILKSPLNSRNRDSRNRAGNLTVGFGSSTADAWIHVLKVLDQGSEQDLMPLALAANSVSGASAGTPEEEAPEATPESVLSPGESKRRLDHQSTDVKSRRVDKPEPHVSLATAIDHVCIGRVWVDVNGHQHPAQGFVRGEAEMICTADYPLGECSHCPFAVVASAPGSTSEANPSSSSQGTVVATDAASTNLSKGDGLLAGEGGGHEATPLEKDLSGGGGATGNSEDESDASILRRCGTGYDTSSDDDDVHHHLVRLQPRTDAMFYTLHPGGSHYSGSCCADALRLWSDPFFMRSVISVWAHQCECGYHARIVDLSIPPRPSYIMAYRFARMREERQACRNNWLGIWKRLAPMQKKRAMELHKAQADVEAQWDLIAEEMMGPDPGTSDDSD